MTLQPLITELSSEFNSWYLDDGALGGSPEKVLRDIQRVIAAQDEYSLNLNIEKCEAFVFGGSDYERNLVWQELEAVAPGIKCLQNGQLSLLGAPLFDKASEPVWKTKCAELKKAIEQLHLLEPHHALFLLRNCLSVPKVMYLLRCFPFWKNPEKLRYFDVLMKESLEKIANIDMNDVIWCQASLPVRRGGLGIRKSEGVALQPIWLRLIYSFCLRHGVQNLPVQLGNEACGCPLRMVAQN